MVVLCFICHIYDITYIIDRERGEERRRQEGGGEKGGDKRGREEERVCEKRRGCRFIYYHYGLHDTKRGEKRRKQKGGGGGEGVKEGERVCERKSVVSIVYYAVLMVYRTQLQRCGVGGGGGAKRGNAREQRNT